jgi:hypothetical protein
MQHGLGPLAETGVDEPVQITTVNQETTANHGGGRKQGRESSLEETNPDKPLDKHCLSLYPFCRA